MEDQPVVVFITVPSRDVDDQIARALLEQNLAACVNIIPSLHSLYTWEGKLCEDEEVLLIVKSRSSLFQQRLIPAVQALHPYQVPEVIALPISMGLESYLKWIGEVTRGT